MYYFVEFIIQNPERVFLCRTQRWALLASSTSTGELLEFAYKSKSRREHVMILNILNWKTALHYAVPMVDHRSKIGPMKVIHELFINYTS